MICSFFISFRRSRAKWIYSPAVGKLIYCHLLVEWTVLPLFAARAFITLISFSLSLASINSRVTEAHRSLQFASSFSSFLPFLPNKRSPASLTFCGRCDLLLLSLTWRFNGPFAYEMNWFSTHGPVAWQGKALKLTKSNFLGPFSSLTLILQVQKHYLCVWTAVVSSFAKWICLNLF